MDAVTESWVPEAPTLDPIPLIVQYGLKLPVVPETPGTIPLDQLLPLASETFRRFAPRRYWM